MNGYVLAELILTLVSIGIRVDAIRSELEVLKLEGKGDGEIEAHLRKMADDAVKAAQQAVQ